jgi:hypothetical protein
MTDTGLVQRPTIDELCTAHAADRGVAAGAGREAG